MIEIEHVTKTYNGINAVDDLTVSIPEGEIFGLLGPNGAGKSTTILMLVGLIQPSSGRCTINGLDVAREPIAVKQLIGYMPEDVGFYANLTAEENLTYFGKLYRMDRARREARIPEVLALTGLDGVEKTVGGYSKGMRQRLGLAKALLNEPSVVVLDEPTANLDPRGVADYRRIIKETADGGATVIVCSHLLEEVSRTCTSVGILSKGRMIAKGAWEDLAAELKAASAGSVKIRVETRDPMPALFHPDIAGITLAEDRRTATITARSDIRDAVSDQLVEHGTRIRSIAWEGLSLEDLFLTYYQETR